MATNDRRDSKKTVKETSRSRAKTKIKLSEDETLENRFTLLCDIGAEQSEDDDTYWAGDKGFSFIPFNWAQNADILVQFPILEEVYCTRFCDSYIYQFYFWIKRINLNFSSVVDWDQNRNQCCIGKQNPTCSLSLSGRTPEELLPSFTNHLLYKQLYNAVTHGLMEKKSRKERSVYKNLFAFILIFISLALFCYIVISLLWAWIKSTCNSAFPISRTNEKIPVEFFL